MSVDYSGALLQCWLMIPGHRRRQRPTQHIAIASPPPVAILPVARLPTAVLQCCTPMIDGDSLPAWLQLLSRLPAPPPSPCSVPSAAYSGVTVGSLHVNQE